MANYFVGPGGDDGATGATWALRKLTLEGAENIPVAANDTVYVGPGTYRETLTVDVSGSAGQPITYIGDYTGANTDGVGGVVRVTGSDDDQAITRTSCIVASGKNYRTFTGFLFEMAAAPLIALTTSCTNWIIDKCVVTPIAGNQIQTAGATQATLTVQNCLFIMGASYGVNYTHSATVSNAGHVVQNCIFWGGMSRCINSIRVGGVTVKNCTFGPGNTAFRVDTALAAGQTVTINNCTFYSMSSPLVCTADGEITENYNTFYANLADRTGGTPANWTGANSIIYPPLYDTRWFFQLAFAGANPSAKQVLSPWDLASYSKILNVAGTSPTSTDLRGTGTIGTQREWGALEYDSTLDIQAKRGSFVSGGFIGGE